MPEQRDRQEQIAEALDDLVMSKGVVLDGERLDWLVEWVDQQVTGGDWVSPVTPEKWQHFRSEYADTAERLVRSRMEFYGYTGEQINAAEALTHEASGCVYEGERWDCHDEDGKSLHPDRDEFEQVAEWVTWVLDELPFRPRIRPGKTGGDDA